MEITQNQLIQLNQIYNTLGLIFTRGEDTIKMAACRQALEALIQVLSISQTEETHTISIPLEQVEDITKK